jgi:hypothetical protein
MLEFDDYRGVIVETELGNMGRTTFITLDRDNGFISERRGFPGDLQSTYFL